MSFSLILFGLLWGGSCIVGLLGGGSCIVGLLSWGSCTVGLFEGNCIVGLLGGGSFIVGEWGLDLFIYSVVFNALVSMVERLLVSSGVSGILCMIGVKLLGLGI